MLARGRCVHCPRLTKHCVGARILSFELLRDTTKTTKNRSASVIDSAQCTKHARGSLRSRSGASQDRLGEIFGRFPSALGPRRNSQDRPRDPFLASRTCPERASARLRNGFERPEPPKINFASIFRRFGQHIRNKIRRISFEPPATRAQIRNLKKASRDPTARLGSCEVQSLRIARTSFEMTCGQYMFSLVSLRTHKPT